MDKIKTFIKHERGALTGLVVGIIILAMLGLAKGCIKVDSVLNPGTKISLPAHRQEAVDIKAMATKWEISDDDAIEQLERIDAISSVAVDTVLGLIAGNFNAANTIGTLIVTSGAGSLADTYRKRKKIKELSA